MSVFNDAVRVPRAVESIVAQMFTNWELIIVNDGSTDGTTEVLASLAAADTRIRVLEQQNSGLTLALIRGCREARAGFIARQDADDVSCPQRLQQQLAMLDNDPGVVFVSCWTDYLGPGGEFLETVTRPQDSLKATHDLLEEQQGPPAHGSVMFRRSAYENAGGYRTEFYYGQDSDLWLRMAERGRIAYVQQRLYRYRRDSTSISGSRQSLQREFGRLGQACRAARRQGRSETPHLEVARQLTAQITRRGVSEREIAKGERQMAYLIGSQLARRGDRRAAKYLWDVIKHSPCHWRAWVRLVQAHCTMKADETSNDD